MIEYSAMTGVLILAQVALRGGETAPKGEIQSLDESGVVVGTAPGMVISWDRVKSVGGEWSQRGEPFLQVAEDAWRARSRLERGDPISAEPLFERLFAEYQGKAGATASVVAEGLLRCRLRRGAHVAAIDPWLSLLVTELRGSSVPVMHAAWATEAGLSPAVDPMTGLVPALPPIWVAWPSVEAFARQEDSTDAEPRTRALRAMYLAAARFECGQAVDVPEVGANEPGSHIVREMLLSRVGEAEQRAVARKALDDRMRGSSAAPTPPWLEAWCRAAIGRSLLREDSAEAKKLGIVELLHIPARFANAHPYLAGVALAEASVALRAMGDTPGADVLARELSQLYPSHPVLEWPRFRSGAPARSAGRP